MTRIAAASARARTPETAGPEPADTAPADGPSFAALLEVAVPGAPGSGAADHDGSDAHDRRGRERTEADALPAFEPAGSATGGDSGASTLAGLILASPTAAVAAATRPERASAGHPNGAPAADVAVPDRHPGETGAERHAPAAGTHDSPVRTAKPQAQPQAATNAEPLAGAVALASLDGRPGARTAHGAGVALDAGEARVVEAPSAPAGAAAGTSPHLDDLVPGGLRSRAAGDGAARPGVPTSSADSSVQPGFAPRGSAHGSLAAGALQQRRWQPGSRGAQQRRWQPGSRGAQQRRWQPSGRGAQRYTARCRAALGRTAASRCPPRSERRECAAHRIGDARGWLDARPLPRSSRDGVTCIPRASPGIARALAIARYRRRPSTARFRRSRGTPRCTPRTARAGRPAAGQRFDLAGPGARVNRFSRALRRRSQRERQHVARRPPATFARPSARQHRSSLLCHRRQSFPRTRPLRPPPRRLARRRPPRRP